MLTKLESFFFDLIFFSLDNDPMLFQLEE